MISRRKVWKRVVISGLYTFTAIILSAILMAIATSISPRIIGGKATLAVVIGSTAITILVYLLSEVIITIIFKAEKPDKEKHKHLISCFESLCQERGVIFGKVRFLWPRLYILNGKLIRDIPNAMAFGTGLFGQYAIGITEPLYKMLNKDELKAVVGHELAHIRCKDVGLMTAITIITCSAEQLSKLCWKSKGASGPLAMLGAVVLYIFAKLIFPVSKSVMAQERELTADALSSLYCGTTQHMISALNKLEEATREFRHQKTIFSDLFITHPSFKQRTEALQSLNS